MRQITTRDQVNEICGLKNEEQEGTPRGKLMNSRNDNGYLRKYTTSWMIIVDYNGYLRKYLFLDDNCVLVMFPFCPQDLVTYLRGLEHNF